jgi:hypothetical protein
MQMTMAEDEQSVEYHEDMILASKANIHRDKTIIATALYSIWLLKKKDEPRLQKKNFEKYAEEKFQYCDTQVN